LLNTPFRELAATQGIGSKKIRSFLKLLARVANSDAADLPADITTVPGNGKDDSVNKSASDGFDASAVSEVVWGKWRASVLRHRLGAEKIGRFAPSLRQMTRVIWNLPMAHYTKLNLAQIRAKKTHGAKRVQAILEAFYCVHKLVDGMEPQDHLAVRIIPRRIDAVEGWVGKALQTPGIPDADDIRAHFVEPLLDQIRADAAQQIVRLAENRLGVHGPITSVRKCARDLGLTRARVYQLLNEINDIMTVRWPMGRHQVHELRLKFESELTDGTNPRTLKQFFSAVELFYPATRRGAAGPMEVAPSPPTKSRDNGENASNLELLEAVS
jgi:hypothetical protein